MAKTAPLDFISLPKVFYNLDIAIFAKLFTRDMLHFSLIQSTFSSFLALLIFVNAPTIQVNAQCIDLKSQKSFTLLKADFEAAVLQHYSFDKSNIAYGYQMYLKDIAERNMPLHMWTATKSVKLAKDFYKTEFFKTQWVSSEEVKAKASAIDEVNVEQPITQAVDVSKQEKDYLLLNPYGAYFDCILTKESNADYVSIIGSLRQVPDLNPELVALTFATQVPELTESMKEYIVMVFYAELLLRVHQVI